MAIVDLVPAVALQRTPKHCSSRYRRANVLSKPKFKTNVRFVVERRIGATKTEPQSGAPSFYREERHEAASRSARSDRSRALSRVARARAGSGSAWRAT